jgi:2-polyprenyl-6-methoxyphenol hydroxylase-like FAD-dependent oxidoreductase
VRSLLQGHDGAVTDAGATVWRGVIDSRAAPVGLCPVGATVCAHSPDGRSLTVTSLGAGGGGLHDGSLFWMLSAPLALPLRPLPVPLSSDYIQPANAEERAMDALTHSPTLPLAAAASAPLVAARVAALFSDFAHVEALLAATPAGAIVERRLFHRTDDAVDDAGADVSGRGVVTLIGDSAHMRVPSLGMGACLSLESAAALADALDALPRGADAAALQAALRRFEREQAERADEAARAALLEAAHVAGKPAGAVLPTSGAAYQGWLLGNARRGVAWHRRREQALADGGVPL